MDPNNFMKTVYLGDRSCKKIVIDGENSEVKIQIDVISRVRSEHWNFYSDEDLADGFLLFKGVKHLSFTPSGFIPNGLIDIREVSRHFSEGNDYKFVFAAESVDAVGAATIVVIELAAESVALLDSQDRTIEEN